MRGARRIKTYSLCGAPHKSTTSGSDSRPAVQRLLRRPRGAPSSRRHHPHQQPRRRRVGRPVRRPHPREQRPRPVRPPRPPDRHGGAEPPRGPGAQSRPWPTPPRHRQRPRGIVGYGSPRQRRSTSLYGPAPRRPDGPKPVRTKKGLAHALTDTLKEASHLPGWRNVSDQPWGNDSEKSHKRYFTSFGMWNAKTEEETKKDFEQVTQELDKDHVKQIKEMKTSFCDDKKMMKPDPIRLKYNTGYRTCQPRDGILRASDS